MNLYRTMMETLDARYLLAADLIAVEVSLPTTGNIVSPGQAIQVDVSMVNAGASAAGSFTVGAKLVPYAFFAPFDSLDLSFDNSSAIALGSVVQSTLPANNQTVASIQATVPGNLTPGTYSIAIKVDSLDQIAESDETQNEGGFADVQVLSNGTMVLTGTADADSVTMTRASNQLTAALPDRNAIYSLASVTGFSISTLGGNDTVVMVGLLPSVRADGGDGNDKIVGGDGDDLLIGGAQKDTLFGGLGNDRLNGNGGNDRLFGEAGVDRLYGYEGNDYLDGGSSGDRLEGGGGIDAMYGQSGNDKFFAQDGAIDQLFGAKGTDTALVDAGDVLSSIETTT